MFCFYIYVLNKRNGFLKHLRSFHRYCCPSLLQWFGRSSSPQFATSGTQEAPRCGSVLGLWSVLLILLLITHCLPRCRYVALHRTGESPTRSENTEQPSRYTALVSLWEQIRHRGWSHLEPPVSLHFGTCCSIWVEAVLLPGSGQCLGKAGVQRPGHLWPRGNL